jgi:autotransporter-associated beta strand protein
MKTSSYLKKYANRASLVGTAFALGLATQTAWSGVIAYDFSENPGNQVLDTVTPKGPLGTTFWNDSNAEGAPASGTESNLVDGTGTPTGASITWSSNNTWSNGSGVGDENARIMVGYLDDGGAGASVTLENIPYAKYNVYGIVGSDAGGEYTTRDFRINGTTWAFPVTPPLLTNSGSTGAAGNATANTGTVVATGALAGSTDPAMAFNSQVARIPYDAALNPAGSFTVACWINPANVAVGSRVLVQSMINGENPGNGDDRTGWVFRQNDNELTFMVGSTGPAGGSVFYTTTATTDADVLTAGVWQYVAVSYDSTTQNISISVNGTEVLAVIAAAPLIPNYAAPVLIGNRGYGGWGYVGSLDEVAIFPGVVPTATLASHYANGIDSGRTTPYATLVQASSPLAYWTGSSTPGVGTQGSGPAFGNWLAAGQEWIRINPATNQRGNYWKVSGMTGSTCTIQGLNSGAGRGSLSSVIIEEVVVPTQLVNVGVETFEAVSLASSLTSVFRAGLDSATVDVPGGFEVAATHSIDITPRPGVASGTYPLIDYSGTIGGAGFAGLSLIPIPNPRYGLTLVDNVAGSSVDLDYVAPTPIVWTGATDTEWADIATTNWKLESDSSPTRFHPFDVVKFDDTASSGTVNITSPVTPVSMVVDNTALLPYDFTGSPIAGTSSLTKTGVGALTIGTANTFTGPVEILGGTVNISAGNNLGASGAGTTLTIDGATLHATASLTLPRRMTIPSAGELEVDDTFQVISSGGFQGGGTLTKSGPGTLRFENYGSGAFSGDLIIETGSAVFTGGAFNGDIGLDSITVATGASLIQPGGASHALGGYFAATPVINLEENGTFTIDQENYFTTINMEGGILNGSSEVRTDTNFAVNVLASPSTSLWSAQVNSVNAPMTFNVADGAAAPDLLMSGLLTNTQAFVKNGPGTMELTGANTFTGNTTVNQGTLALSGAGSFDTSPVVDVKAGAFIDVTGIGAPWLLPQVQILKGSGTVTGDLDLLGTVEPGATAGTLTVDGVFTLNSFSQYVWEVSDWGNGAVAGTGFDTLIADSVAIVADSANPIYITVKPSEITGYIEENRTFPLIQTTGGITGFSADAFDIDASALFEAAPTFGTWSVAVQGTNLVLVYTAGTLTGFQSWVTGAPYNLLGSDALPGADPDGDGISNAIEFVIGGDPAAGDDNSKLPTGAVVGANFEFTFRRTDLSNYAPFPFAEYGSNLTGWTAVAAVTVTDDFYGPGIDRVVASVPQSLAVGGKVFVRLNANP